MVASRLTGNGPSSADGGLRVDVLDVGQGDAILLRPPRSPAILVDAGPPDAAVADHLAELGVDELGALVITHPDLDHVGGAQGLLARVEVHEVLFARLDRATRAAASAAGADLERVSAGAAIGSRSLHLEVLWPPPTRLGLGPPAEPNELSLVLLVRWRGFRMLLTGDAEAELAPVEPGDVDVLKVAHHGSDDAGLEALLARTDPELALISVGEDNSYGHPTATTLATLEAASVPVLRTDVDGTIEVSAEGRLLERRQAMRAADPWSRVAPSAGPRGPCLRPRREPTMEASGSTPNATSGRRIRGIFSTESGREGRRALATARVRSRARVDLRQRGHDRDRAQPR